MKLNLTLSIEETNLILTSLGRLPFARVFQLVGKIQEQANEQLAPTPADPQANGKLEPQPEAPASAG